MVKIIISVLILFLSLSIYSQNRKISVTINGIENEKGHLIVGVYNTALSFPIYGKEIIKKSLKPIIGQTTCSFELASGSYAIAVWHDEDNNEILDKNFFGVPTEKYGFSKNAKALIGAPDFLDATFLIENDSIKNLVIELK